MYALTIFAQNKNGNERGKEFIQKYTFDFRLHATNHEQNFNNDVKFKALDFYVNTYLRVCVCVCS